MMRPPDENPLSATLIIPQYNQPELTVQAIESLRRHDSHHWPIVVVANGCSPHSIRQLHQIQDSRVEIVSRPCPGLTAAWNVAAHQCRTDFLVFLNNDTLSTGPWLERLLAPLASNQAGMTGVQPRWETHLPSPCEVVAGWCFAIPRSTFRAVQGFDEALRLYFSDTDLQLRVREHHATFTTPPWLVVPDLPITHRSHSTTRQLSDRRAIWNEDRQRFLARWNGSR